MFNWFSLLLSHHINLFDTRRQLLRSAACRLCRQRASVRSLLLSLLDDHSNLTPRHPHQAATLLRSYASRLLRPTPSRSHLSLAEDTSTIRSSPRPLCTSYRVLCPSVPLHAVQPAPNRGKAFWLSALVEGKRTQNATHTLFLDIIAIRAYRRLVRELQNRAQAQPGTTVMWTVQTQKVEVQPTITMR